MFIVLFGLCSYLSTCFFPTDKYVRILAPLREGNIPTIEVEIQGKIYPFDVDLSLNPFPVYMRKETLNELEKKPKENVKIVINEDEIELQTYLLPKIKMGDLVCNNVLVREIDADKVKKDKETVPKYKVGLKFFERSNFLLDFYNSSVIFCNDVSKLKEVGYALEKMTQIPFEVGNIGLVLNVKTDFGLLRLVVSTSSTLSMIKSEFIQYPTLHTGLFGLEMVTSSSFIFGEKNFGVKDLYFYDFSLKYSEVDGLIGMDFLKENEIYFDWENKIAYIKSAL